MNERGAALLISLMVVALLSIVVIEFTDSTTTEAHLARNARNAAQARWLARAGLALGEIALLTDFELKTKEPERNPNVETLGDVWARPFPPEPIGPGIGDAGYRIVDESSRFNLNSLALGRGGSPILLEARKMLFQSILAAVGLDTNLLFPLIDWLDADDEVSPNGAESQEYEQRSPPYRPRNGRLLDVDELGLVLGYGELTRVQWGLLRRLVTVLPSDELRLNVNTVEPELLAAIFSAMPGVPEAVLSLRAEQPITAADLAAFPGWNELPVEIRSIFGVNSQTFTIHAVGVAGGVAKGLAVTERRLGARLQVLEWREEPGSVALTSGGPFGGIRASASDPSS